MFWLALFPLLGHFYVFQLPFFKSSIPMIRFTHCQYVRLEILKIVSHTSTPALPAPPGQLAAHREQRRVLGDDGGPAHCHAEDDQTTLGLADRERADAVDGFDGIADECITLALR